jgi:hypothetical protein
MEMNCMQVQDWVYLETEKLILLEAACMCAMAIEQGFSYLVKVSGWAPDGRMGELRNIGQCWSYSF